MPPIACLYDVHGNLPALEAVLVDVASQGATVGLLGGDYALFGGWPEETVARLRALPDAIWIRGNVDRWTADPAGAPDDPVVQGAIAACARRLGPERVAELGGLATRTVSGETLAVHGSPLSDVRSFLPEPGPDDDELLDGERPKRLLFGHTHLAFARTRADGVQLVNPGSVGIPLDGDHRASYAILHDDGAVEHRRVGYDFEASAQRIRDAFDGAPWTEVPAGRIMRAEF